MGKRKSDDGLASAEKKPKSTEKKKRPSSGQGTIANAFKAAKDQNTNKPPLEQKTKAAHTINNYGSANIDITFQNYLAEVSEKMRGLPPPEETVVPGRRKRSTRKVSGDIDSYKPPECNTLEAKPEESLIGEDGYRYLRQLAELTSSTTMPTKRQLQNVVSIVRNHGLHGRRDLSPLALNYLQHVVKLHPSVKVEYTQGAEKVPYVLVNDDAWSLTECVSDFNLDPFDLDLLERRSTAFQILEHLVQLAHSALFSQYQGKAPARGFAVTSGEFFLWKWIISEFQEDLKARLTVFNSIPGREQRDRKAALLQNSQLWRTFSNSAMSTVKQDRRNLVRLLMEIVAAPAEPEVLNDACSLEELALNASELSNLASQLLRMLLELYGTAEEFKMFFKNTVNRTTTSGMLENVRMTMEDAMLEGFTGMNQVLKTLPQKQAFLIALPHKDRMRLLTMVVAMKHAKRKTDQERYPSLEAFYRLYHEPGSVDAYLRADPIEALKYISDDMKGNSLSFNLVDRTADGLALLVANLCQSAANELPEGKLQALGTVLDKIVQTMKESQGGKARQSLAPKYILALRAAQHSLQPIAVEL